MILDWYDWYRLDFFFKKVILPKDETKDLVPILNRLLDPEQTEFQLAEDIKALTALCSSNSPCQSDAIVLFAYCLRNGLGVKKDNLHAINILQIPAAQQYSPALNELGNCYRFSGRNSDLKRALKFYEKVAAQGYPPALTELSDCYQCGVGIKEDRKLGAELCRQAADQGYAIAQYLMIDCYREGWGVKRDLNLAIEYCCKALEQEHPAAGHYLNTLVKEARAEGMCFLWGAAKKKVNSAARWQSPSLGAGAGPRLGVGHAAVDKDGDNIEDVLLDDRAVERPNSEGTKVSSVRFT